MFFWKIDDETIRCLINKEEIGQMGFDLKELGEDNEQMEEFLNARHSCCDQLCIYSELIL